MDEDVRFFFYRKVLLKLKKIKKMIVRLDMLYKAKC